MNIDGKAVEAIVNFIAAALPIADDAERLQKQAADRAKEAEKKAASVVKAIAPVVDTLAKAGYITNEQRVKAAESLKDPVKVLETLQRITLSSAIKSAQEVGTLGSASTPKKDTTPTVKKAAVGSHQSAADAHFLTSFGLA